MLNLTIEQCVRHYIHADYSNAGLAAKVKYANMLQLWVKWLEQFRDCSPESRLAKNVLNPKIKQINEFLKESRYEKR
jgi:hypothetical protein